MNASMDKPLLKPILQLSVWMQEKALKGNTEPVKITPLTNLEPKRKMTEWLSCWTKG